MKRVITLMLIAFIGMFSFVTTAGAESYTYDEASFEIPDGCMTSYVSDYCDIKLVADDDSAEFRLSRMNNYDGLSFVFMPLDEVERYYADYLTSIVGEFEILNVQNYGLSGNSYSINLDGVLYSDNDEHFFDVYICSTETYIYVFEFIVYEDAGFYLINEIINSINVFDYATVVESSSEVGVFAEIIGFIFILAFIIISFIVVVNLKRVNHASVNRAEKNERADSLAQYPKPGIIKEKFELNGKSINAFNERFTVGGDDNFALKELKRERKERENLFK